MNIRPSTLAVIMRSQSRRQDPALAFLRNRPSLRLSPCSHLDCPAGCCTAAWIWPVYWCPSPPPPSPCTYSTGWSTAAWPWPVYWCPPTPNHPPSLPAVLTLLHRVVYCSLALACLLVATTSVHGLGGRLKFRGQVQQRPSAAAAAAAGRPGKARGERRTSSAAANASTCSANVALQTCPKDGGGGLAAAAAAAAVAAAAGSLLAESASVLSEAAASGIEAASGRSALLLSSLSMRGMRALSSVREALPSLPGGDEVDVDEELWSFWQPFQGGRVFVATQVKGEGGVVVVLAAVPGGTRLCGHTGGCRGGGALHARMGGACHCRGVRGGDGI